MQRTGRKMKLALAKLSVFSSSAAAFSRIKAQQRFKKGQLQYLHVCHVQQLNCVCYDSHSEHINLSFQPSKGN